MPKVSRILRLLSLLSRRDSVSLEAIKQVCGIPERTAYRYLNSLSEAEVPLYYDRETKGYRLANSPSILARSLTDTEIIVLISSLILMSKHLNTFYQGAIESIVSKVCSNYNFPKENISVALGADPPIQSAVPEYSLQLTLAIVQMAIANKKTLILTKGMENNYQETVSLKDPSLAFNRGWQVRGQSNRGSEEIQISTIINASTSIQSGANRPIR